MNHKQLSTKLNFKIKAEKRIPSTTVRLKHASSDVNLK